MWAGGDYSQKTQISINLIEGFLCKFDVRKVKMCQLGRSRSTAAVNKEGLRKWSIGCIEIYELNGFCPSPCAYHPVARKHRRMTHFLSPFLTPVDTHTGHQCNDRSWTKVEGSLCNGSLWLLRNPKNCASRTHKHTSSFTQSCTHPIINHRQNRLNCTI